MMKVICEQCGRSQEFSFSDWRCTCGGAWYSDEVCAVDKTRIDQNDQTIWRYSRFFPEELQKKEASLSAGGTPLLPMQFAGQRICVKMDSMNPTGSFKDRGVEFMMNSLKAQSVQDVVEDSSGNAGASVAAYAARLGMRAAIYAPESASPAKISQISLFGADVHLIPGARMNATQALFNALDSKVVYASHAYNPIYLMGQQTVAWEVWEQLNFEVPDWVVVPVGQGGHLLGYYEGFRALKQVGQINKLPGIIAVQPQRLAPICDAIDKDWQEWQAVSAPATPSAAEGLAITHPVRWKHILRAIRESGGFCVRVSEEQIITAQRDMAKQGFFIEPTSAVVPAALEEVYRKIGNGQRIVISLTGNGLKSLH